MSAKTFYLCIGLFGVAAVIMLATNIDDLSDGGRFRFICGLALFTFVVIILLLVFSLRAKKSNGREYMKKMPLADLMIDNDAKLVTVRYIEGGKVISKNFRKSAVRIVIDEEGKHGRVATLKIDGLEKYYSYRFWFIRWPEKTVVTETYAIVISRPLEEVLDFYAIYARR